MTILDDTFLALLRNVEATVSSSGNGRLDEIGNLLIDSLHLAVLVTHPTQAVPCPTDREAA